METISKKIRFVFLGLALCVCGILAPSARAQFLGYTSPQTTQATLATALPCTGTEQDFTTGITPKFNNIGQTQHFVSAVSPSTVTEFRVVIQGIDNQGNVLNISDVGSINGNITASGYFPNIRVAVTCLPAVTGTFSLSYSGTSSTAPIIAGSFLGSQLDKLVFNGVSASANQTIGPVATPFGSSSGRLMFQYVTSSVAGSLIFVGCRGSTTIGDFNNFTFNLANTTAIQSFSVPAGQCPNYTVGYTSGGAAGTALAEYIFDPPGALPATTQMNGCQSQDLALSTTAAITVGANTTVRIIAPSTTQRVAVCGLLLTAGVAGTAQLIEGTGATCGTGTANLSGAMPLAVGTPLAIGAAAPIFPTLAVGDGVCINTAGGATVAGMISFIYIPI